MNYAKDITSEYTASYAKYVATSRAIPSLIDGLKPVNRRCINSANDLKLYHDKKFLKVAKLEGQILGDYHPHGGASPVILAQPFKTRYPLFEGQGNFGSPDNPSSVAASRYIECRLTEFCEDFYLASSDYADKEDNYDGRLKEVTQYYPPIPGSLITGASGIAVGLSTNIPTHTIKDVCESLLSYLDSNSPKGNYLRVIMPETCEESVILTPKDEIKKLYETGEGSIKYKAKTHYESIEGKLALVVDAFPPDYRKKSLETSYILDAVEAGSLELRNESKEGVRYVFLSSEKEILEFVEERLVSSTGYRMYIEHRGKIRCYTLSQIYDDFIQARNSYIVKKYSDLLHISLKERNYLSVLLKIKVDKEYIKSLLDMTSEEAMRDLNFRYSLDREVAARILNTSLRSLMADNTVNLNDQLRKLESSMKDYETYIENPQYKLVKDIEELLCKYKHEVRRAMHIEDIQECIDIVYKDKTITTHPSSVFYVATTDNSYTKIHAAELLEMDLNDKIVVASDYDYYVFYDSKGLIAITSQVMSAMDNKFKSKSLTGIIGTNDLSTISLKREGSRKVIQLGDWALRTRSSYIKQTEDGSITLIS